MYTGNKLVDELACCVLRVKFGLKGLPLGCKFLLTVLVILYAVSVCLVDNVSLGDT